MRSNFLLTAITIYCTGVAQGAQLGLIGNPVQFGSGPAAVNGDEICYCHCLVLIRWEGAKE